METILKGKMALLLAEGCKLNKQKKEIEKRLEEIKKEIEINSPGDYVNEAKDALNVAEVERFSDVSPKDVLDWLKRQKPSMVSKFPETVKVQITQLERFVPKSVINGWRFPLDSTLRWTWK